MNTKISTIGEFGLISQIAKLAATRADVIKGISDDAAVLRYNAKKYLLFTTDMLAEGVHFTRSMGGRPVGYKALACNISDIAAMGGLPTHAVVSLGVPSSLDTGFVMAIYKGMNVLAKNYGIGIVGGDTIRSPKIMINVALIGEVYKDHLVTRVGAKKGDMLFVSGSLGRTLQSGKHLHFIPRIKESQYLVRKFKPTAMIDISDGLASDLGHILEESRVGAIIDGTKVPRNKQASISDALHDGEDFELLFTLSPSYGQRLLAASQKPFHFYHIGEVVDKNEGLSLLDSQRNKRSILTKGFKHF